MGENFRLTIHIFIKFHRPAISIEYNFNPKGVNKKCVRRDCYSQHHITAVTAVARSFPRPRGSSPRPLRPGRNQPAQTISQTNTKSSENKTQCKFWFFAIKHFNLPLASELDRSLSPCSRSRPRRRARRPGWCCCGGRACASSGGPTAKNSSRIART